MICSVSLLAQYPDMVFPLHVGDRWEYNESGFISESIAFCDTIMPNNLSYTKIVGSLFSGYYRQEGPRVYTYNTRSEKDTIVYDFSLSTGDTLDIIGTGGDILLTTVTGEGIQNYFGENRHYMIFMTDELYSSWDGSDVIADGIGFVQYYGELLFYGLSGAIINGVQYGEIVGIEKPVEQLPNEFRLFQNYPNPFNPSTVISYSLPKSDNIKIVVYDILGRQLEILYEGYKNGGLHRSIFNGDKYPSGVFIYSITSSNSILSKKMLLLK